MNFKTIHPALSGALLLLATVIVLYGCHAMGQSEIPGIKTFFAFDSITVSPKLKDLSNLIFRNGKEPADRFSIDTVQKPKTSSVRFVFVNDSINAISTTEQSKCNAFMKGDSLKIDIGTSDGFTGCGVTATCIRNGFTTIIYRFFDSNPYYQSRLHIINEKQTLTLDKSNYAVGDSLFGTIYTRQVDNQGLKSYASGMFRAKVKASFNQ